MEDDNKFSYFFLGLGLGVAVGLLFAPKSGSETRDLLLSKADEGKEFLKRRSSELRDSAVDAVEKGKSAVNRQKDLSRAPGAAIGLCCAAAVWRNALRCSAPSLHPPPYAARTGSVGNASSPRERQSGVT